MSEFIKVGKTIQVKPVGSDYDLVAGQIYNLAWDGWNGRPVFTENDGELNLPKKVYELKKDTVFKKRVLKYFESPEAGQTTGVMLAGTKGTGKTVLAKVIAKDSNLPIIIVKPDYPAAKLPIFFNEFKSEVCVIFDEIEKNWDTNKMLEFLDGVQSTAKKLVLMTCNNINRVTEYMQDRCSRVRYLRKYTGTENIELIERLVEDFGVKNPKEVTTFLKNRIELLSMDNVCAFLNEVKLLEGEDVALDEIIEIMNISTKGGSETKGSAITGFDLSQLGEEDVKILIEKALDEVSETNTVRSIINKTYETLDKLADEED